MSEVHIFSCFTASPQTRGQPDTFLDKLAFYCMIMKEFFRLRFLSTLAFIDPLSHKNKNGSDIRWSLEL